MPASTVTRLRPRGQPPYTDTLALNDIHALLTTGTGDCDRELLGDIAAILARARRPLVPARHIGAELTDSPIGWPVARVDAEDTAVAVRQDPAGPGLLIEITTSGQGERDLLVVTLDGRCLHHPARLAAAPHDPTHP